MLQVAGDVLTVYCIDDRENTVDHIPRKDLQSSDSSNVEVRRRLGLMTAKEFAIGDF